MNRKRMLLGALALMVGACANEPEESGSGTMSGVDSGDMPALDYQPMQDDGGECMTVCPAGERGEPGEAGPRGSDGSSCSVTQSGDSATINCTDGTVATVTSGEDGIDGSDGVDGTSLPGPAGPQGPVGPTGATGAVGPIGPAGAKGDKGDPGADGKDGMFDVSNMYINYGYSNSGINQGGAACNDGDVAVGGMCWIREGYGGTFQMMGLQGSAERPEVPHAFVCKQYSAPAPTTCMVYCIDMSP